MTSTPEDFRPHRFSLDDFPLRERDEAFRELYGRTIMRLELEPKPDIPFTMDMELRALPDFGMASGTCMPVNCRRTSPLIDSDDLILVAILTGCGTFQTRGKEAQVGSGQAALTNSAEPGTFDVHVPLKGVSFRLALHRIAPLLADVGAAILQPIPRNAEALRLLTSYVESLRSDIALAQPELRASVVAHIYDLAALAIGATYDATAIARHRGVRAARLQAIKAYIANNLGQYDLSLSAIAAHHGVTPRYVGMLFESEPETLSEYVLHQRLVGAHRMLTDPRLSARTISSIAYDIGFSDVSYFNRVFRRRYGATPSDVREAARQQE